MDTIAWVYLDPDPTLPVHSRCSVRLWYFMTNAFLLISFTFPSICSVVYQFHHISPHCFNCVKAPTLLINVHQVHTVVCSCWLLDLFHSFLIQVLPNCLCLSKFPQPWILMTLVLGDLSPGGPEVAGLYPAICSLAAGVGLSAWSPLATAHITGQLWNLTDPYSLCNVFSFFHYSSGRALDGI